jgi:hypothetical protein
MIDEDIPVIYEVDIFMGAITPPNGYCVFKFSNGDDYSGFLKDGVPHGQGAKRTKQWIYIGEWKEGTLNKGKMLKILNGVILNFPLQLRTN